MNVKNLPLKFGFVAVLIAACLLAVKCNGLKEGIDLNGGSIVIFEVRTPEAEKAKFEAQKAELQAELELKKADLTPKQRKELEDQIAGLDQQIKYNTGLLQNSRNISEEVISVLKKRVDPNGLYSLEWVSMPGGSRIQVRMPAGQTESRHAKEVYDRALRDAEARNVSRSQIRRLLQASPAQRQGVIDEMVRGIHISSEQANDLKDLVAKYESCVQAQQQLAPLEAKVRDAEKAVLASRPATQPGTDPKVQEARKALADAQDAVANREMDYQTVMRKIESSNITEQNVRSVLMNYVSTQEKSVMGDSKKGEIARRSEAYDDGKKALQKKYAARRGDLDAIINAYENWANGRKRLDDPSDLVRLIRKAGVLEFRMGPFAADVRESSEYQLSRDQQQVYLTKLQSEGPEPGHRRGDQYQWFPLHDENESHGAIVSGEYGGKTYVLLSNEEKDTLLNVPGNPQWTLTDARPSSDEMGRPAVGFSFDPRGASKFAALTGAHRRDQGKGRPGDMLVTLLDDEVYSIASINAVISDSGIISGRFSQQEVVDLVNIFKAGSLPARLNPDPVSISNFGSSMGDINKKQSMKAAIIALGAVAVFMLIYYFLSGLIADLALVLNIVLILGAMAVFGAAFTMPGIAGLILTIGMAVDSNVLINERLREEQDRGLPIRMAFKNAYDRAFTAIFDSHLTALITCLVLYWVGTEEVKGFAVTLGLGVAFNLFSAVFVTKWIVQVMLNVGMIRSHQYMLRLIHVPKIDWMAKRYYFWGFSLITAVLGILALVSEGGRIWGIEFSAGTQATLVFQPDAMVKGELPNDSNVKEIFKAKAEELAQSHASVDRAATLAKKKELEAKLSQPGIEPQLKEDLDNQVKQLKEQLRDYRTLYENVGVETVIDPDKVEKFMKLYDKSFDSTRGDNKITLEQWKAARGNMEFFAKVDVNGNKVLEQDELVKSLPAAAYRVNTTENDLDMIKKVATEAFGSALANRQRLAYHVNTPSDPGDYAKLGIAPGADGKTFIMQQYKNANPEYRDDIEDFEGGVLVVVTMDGGASVSTQELEQRLNEVRMQPEEKPKTGEEPVVSQATNPRKFIGLTPAGEGKFSSFMVLTRAGDASAVGTAKARERFASSELTLIGAVMHREDSMTATNVDPLIAGQTKQKAIIAVVLSWLAIIAYLWLRFGSASWGLAAVLCLVHDSIIVVGMVAVSDWLSQTAIGKSLLIGSFKIDLAMIAAILTIIGYSVSDTIVVFDRIRENRGKLKTVSYQVINNSINQTLSRTLLTVFTVFVVVMIMYVYAGESIRNFNYALLVGIFFGCYSSIAVAAPILLGFKQMVSTKAIAATEGPAEPSQPETPEATQGK